MPIELTPATPSSGSNPASFTTLAAVKAELRISSSDTTEDVRLERMINAASEAIEDDLGRKLARETMTEYIEGNGKRDFYVSRWPIISVTSIELAGSDDFEGAEELEASDYRVDLEGGAIRRLGGHFWPVVAPRSADITGDPVLSQAEQNIRVIYVGGFITPAQATDDNPRTLPTSIEEVTIRIVDYWFNHGEMILSERQPGGHSYTTVPEHIMKRFSPMLNKFRRWL